MKKTTLFACAIALALPGAAHASSGYHLLRSVPLGGDTFWDALTLDPVNHRLFITHGDRVLVVDSRSYTVVGEIGGLNGVHQVAIAGTLGKGFVTQGGADTVAVFDAKTLAVTGTIKVGSRPDGIVYDPASRRVFTLNAGSKNATAIDVASGTVDGTVPLGGKPEFAVADGRGHVYDNIEDTSEIVEIDAKTMDVTRRWPLAPCTEPSGLAIDKVHRMLFAACDNAMMAAVDIRNGKVVATVPTGKRSDGAAFDPGRREVFIPNGEGKLTVIRESAPDKYSLVENVPTQFGARTVEIDPAAHRIFTVTADLTPAPGQHPPYKMAPGSFRLLVYGR
jgi:YVTN family beta-propeller protein